MFGQGLVFLLEETRPCQGLRKVSELSNGIRLFQGFFGASWHDIKCVVVKMSRGLIAGYKWSSFPASVAFPLWACTIAGSLLGHYNFPALCNNYIASGCLIKCFRRFNLENLKIAICEIQY